MSGIGCRIPYYHSMLVGWIAVSDWCKGRASVDWEASVDHQESVGWSARCHHLFDHNKSATANNTTFKSCSIQRRLTYIPDSNNTRVSRRSCFIVGCVRHREVFTKRFDNDELRKKSIQQRERDVWKVSQRDIRSESHHQKPFLALLTHAVIRRDRWRQLTTASERAHEQFIRADKNQRRQGTHRYILNRSFSKKKEKNRICEYLCSRIDIAPNQRGEKKNGQQPDHAYCY